MFCINTLQRKLSSENHTILYGDTFEGDLDVPLSLAFLEIGLKLALTCPEINIHLLLLKYIKCLCFALFQVLILYFVYLRFP